MRLTPKQIETFRTECWLFLPEVFSAASPCIHKPTHPDLIAHRDFEPILRAEGNALFPLVRTRPQTAE